MLKKRIANEINLQIIEKFQGSEEAQVDDVS
jgi:hypothetical protein